MKKLAASILVAIAMAFPLAAAAEWTSTDTAWEAAFVAVTIGDWGQTRDLVRRPCYEDYYEANPLIGKHPSIGRVDKYFAVFILGHAAVSYVIPDEWRRSWQILTFASQVAIVARNHHIGLRVEF